MWWKRKIHMKRPCWSCKRIVEDGKAETPEFTKEDGLRSHILCDDCYPKEKAKSESLIRETKKEISMKKDKAIYIRVTYSERKAIQGAVKRMEVKSVSSLGSDMLMSFVRATLNRAPSLPSAKKRRAK